MTPFLNAKILVKLGLVSLLPLALAGSPLVPRGVAAEPNSIVATVTLRPATFSHRPAGEFTRERLPVDAPAVRARLAAPIAVMTAQVSEANYDRCVQAGGCRPLARRGLARPDVPVVGVSWDDATAYARWLSAQTGDTWRLPTDEEWTFAAGSRVRNDAVGNGDFSQRWLARYEQEAARQRSAAARPIGSFGANENGLFDLAGNVWEWTDTCFTRYSLDAQDQPLGEPSVNCGVRVVQGAHRSYVSSFIRDARGGGCAVGVPPDNLGFRLVREEKSWIDRAVSGLRKRFGRAG